MELDLFSNYQMQREELLARIAESLQLDNTRRLKMESSYHTVAKILQNDSGFFKDLDVDVYPQGSVSISTTSKPLKNSEFDLDVVLHIKRNFVHFTPNQIYNEVVRVLSNDERYVDRIEKKNRCIRLKYANDFHIDIMPACLKFDVGETSLKVPDRERKNWVDSNPKGFIEWFLKRASSLDRSSILQQYHHELIKMKAEIQALPDDEFYNKTPLQRSVQLTKRYRDIFFEGNDTYATSSIVLTTLMGQYYKGENSIFETIDNILYRVKNQYQMASTNSQRFKILNPVNEHEDFTDKWTNEHFLWFKNFIQDFHEKWSSLKKGFELGGKDYIRLFGEGIYKKTLQEQLTQMSVFSKNVTSVSNGLIISGGAYTDRNGNVNSTNGLKNEPHRNYAD